MKESTIPEFKEAYQQIISFFRKIATYLLCADSTSKKDKMYRTALSTFHFHEVNGINLGFSKSGYGSGWGNELSEKILFDREVTTEQLLFVVKSAYGCVRKIVWQNEADGWRREEKEPRAIVQLAGLHLLCGEAGEESDELFWEKDQKSNTKEIEA